MNKLYNEIPNRIHKEKISKFKISISFLCIIVSISCAIFSGILPQKLLTSIILMCSLILASKNKSYLLFPLMLFYQEPFGKLMLISVYRWYSFIFFFDYLYHIRKITIVKRADIIPISILGIYCLIVVLQYSFQLALFSIFDILIVLILCREYLLNRSNCSNFFKIFSIVALASFVSGLIINNILIYDSTWNGVEIVRKMATFEDPNYMGFFYTISIFSLLSLKLFKPIVRYLIVIVLFAMILSSVSLTALLVNSVLIVIYFFVTRKIKFKWILVFVLTILLSLVLYNYGISNIETPVIGQLSFRINEKISLLQKGDINHFTTSRYSLSQQHLEYFSRLPLLNQLFGGTPSNTSFMSPIFEKLSHNEYIDMLLNIGILGTILMIFYMIFNINRAYQMIRENDDYYVFCFMSKVTWVIYMFTLTTFLDHRFLLPFFL